MRASNVVVLDERSPHIRNTRDGMTITLDVICGIYTIGQVGSELMEDAWFSSGGDNDRHLRHQ